MGNTYPDRQKDDDDRGDVIRYSKKSHKSANISALQFYDFKELTLAKSWKPGRTLIMKLLQSDPYENMVQELFLKQYHYLGISIPKQLVSLEERYLKRCMELIDINAILGTRCAVSVNLSPFDMGLMSGDTMLRKSDTFDASEFAIDYPNTVGDGDLVLSSEDDGIVGSIMESDSMMSILSSPLFQRLRILDRDAGLDKRCTPSDYQGSPDYVTLSPSWYLRNETSDIRNQGYTSDFVKRSSISESIVSSACSSSQGMLHFTWDNGIPHFVFTLDDQKEVYVASPGKAKVAHEKELDYLYSFHVKANEKTFSDISGIESDTIGNMRVSSSFSLCPGNSKVMKTEFVLVGTNYNYSKEIHSLSRNNRRSKKLSKVKEIFKAGSSHKFQTPFIFSDLNANPEDILETGFIPNFELAALVVKEHLQNENNQQHEIGGWGLNFLKKDRKKPTIDSLSVSVSSECCRCNSGDCSTSMDIIVPAGLHGGPRTRNEGPSGLIERWRSRGHCDCGGWDIGCPLKVLKARPISVESWRNSESHGNCESFDMCTEGSEQGTPTLKMVSIRDGLYFISFQSSFLSALQCFAISVATIHSKCPSLRPKLAHE